MEGQFVDASSGGAPESIASAGLGGHVARGFASTTISAVLVKGVTFVGQIILAWYLTKRDFGLAATALGASVFPAQIKEFGITQLLQRHPRRGFGADHLGGPISLLGVGAALPSAHHLGAGPGCSRASLACKTRTQVAAGRSSWALGAHRGAGSHCSRGAGGAEVI